MRRLGAVRACLAMGWLIGALAQRPPPSTSSPATGRSPAPGPFAIFIRHAAPVCGQDGEAQEVVGTKEQKPVEGSEFLSFEEWRRKSEEAARMATEAGEDASAVLKEEEDEPAPGRTPDDPTEHAADAKEPSPEDAELAVRTPLTQPDPHAGTGGPLDPLPALKSRSNYASFDCAATINRASPSSRSPSSILSEKKDRYMLTPCSTRDKHVVVELCDEIEIDTVVIANFEFFSSMFKFVRMRVAGRLEGDWLDAGTFRARNFRGLQVFPIANLSGFFRYVRLDFLTHYGAEYYCPVSLVRVYGLTQIDAYRRDQDRERKRARSVTTASVVATRVVTVEPEPASSTDATLATTVEPSRNASAPSVAPSVNSTASETRARAEEATVESARPTTSPAMSQNASSADEPRTNATSPLPPVQPSAQPPVQQSPPPAGQSPAGQPPTGQAPSGQKSANGRDNESIYGTIMKRLKALESNQSLSHSYVEEHGRLLRGAFARVDHRLEDFDGRTSRQETLLRQVLRDFEAYQIASARDRQALADEVAALAEGLMLGKRLVLGQILALLGLVVFVGLTRGAPSIPLQLIPTPRAPPRPTFSAAGQRMRKGSSYVFEARAGSASPVGPPVSPRAGFPTSRTGSVKRAKVGSPRRTLAAEPRPEREGRSVGPPKVAKHKALARSQTPPPRLQDLARSLPAAAYARAPLSLGPIRPSDASRSADRLAVPSPSGGGPRRGSTGQWADWATETASSVATESESDAAPSDLDSPLGPGFRVAPSGPEPDPDRTTREATPLPPTSTAPQIQRHEG